MRVVFDKTMQGIITILQNLRIKIKNEESQTSKRIRQLKSKNRLLLTGTPL